MGAALVDVAAAVSAACALAVADSPTASGKIIASIQPETESKGVFIGPTVVRLATASKRIFCKVIGFGLKFFSDKRFADSGPRLPKGLQG